MEPNKWIIYWKWEILNLLLHSCHKPHFEKAYHIDNIGMCGILWEREKGLYSGGWGRVFSNSKWYSISVRAIKKLPSEAAPDSIVVG
jgi:hypothetical protein